MHNLAAYFQISPSSGVPIFRQIIDQVRALAASGRWKAETMLPSIRQMATELEINMMTVSKAYARLEAEGVVERVRGTGMRIKAATVSGSVAARKAQLQPLTTPLITRGHQLGLTNDQILAVLEAALRETKEKT